VELTPEIFGTKFDVILIDPPWEEYVRRAPGMGDEIEWWTPQEIMALRIEVGTGGGRRQEQGEAGKEVYVRWAPGMGDGIEWWTPQEIMVLRIE
ncbi:unnamed protein product, partial [Closterium sp. NIES-53]